MSIGKNFLNNWKHLQGKEWHHTDTDSEKCLEWFSSPRNDLAPGDIEKAKDNFGRIGVFVGTPFGTVSFYTPDGTNPDLISITYPDPIRIFTAGLIDLAPSNDHLLGLYLDYSHYGSHNLGHFLAKIGDIYENEYSKKDDSFWYIVRNLVQKEVPVSLYYEDDAVVQVKLNVIHTLETKVLLLVLNKATGKVSIGYVSPISEFSLVWNSDSVIGFIKDIHHDELNTAGVRLREKELV